MPKLKLAFLILALFSTGIFAQRTGYGVGLILGEPTGISAKYWLDNESALNAGLAYSFTTANKGFSLHLDLINHLPSNIYPKENIPFYYGFGVRIRSKARTSGSLGVRGVAGLVWQHKKYPVDIFAEVAPVFQLLPETNLLFDLAIGGRYYIK